MRKQRRAKTDPFKWMADSIDYNLTSLAASSRLGDSKEFLSLRGLHPLTYMPMHEPYMSGNVRRRALQGMSPIARVDEFPSPFRGAVLLGDEHDKQSQNVCLVEEIDKSKMRLAWGVNLCGRPIGKVLRLVKYRVRDEGYFTGAVQHYVFVGEMGSWRPLVGDIVVESASKLGRHDFVRHIRHTGNRYRQCSYNKEKRLSESLVDICLATEDLRKNCWTVQFAPAGCPVSMTIPTDPAGVLDMLRFREKKGPRREALLHWVRSHNRKICDDPETIVKVREHLRGSRGEFEWYGLIARVKESVTAQYIKA